MENNKQISVALNRLKDECCYKILYIDITADTFEVISAGDFEWDQKEKPSKISECFLTFADGPLCHDNDRERFKQFMNLNTLKKAFEDANFKKIGFVFRSKFDLADIEYSTVSTSFFPSKNEEGHYTAYLFVSNITSQIQQYNSILDEDAKIQNYASKKRTLLIVEDNEMNREILSEILEDEYEILQAENGAIGLELLQKHMMEISVVLLDVQMPVMNGYEFLEHSQKDPFLSKIPVIVATGSDSAQEERVCLHLGASDFVTKPYNPDIIKSRIANIIRLKESVATMSILQTDERTGLYTLQAFYYHTRLMIDQAQDKNFSVIIFDINHFKDINENYGEAIGDSILQQIANCIKGYIAGSDINGRFGAARFLLLREKTSDEETESWINGLFSSLKEACSIKGINFKVGIYDDVDKSLSISIMCDRAITALNSIGKNFEKWYAKYDAKQAEKEKRLTIMEEGMQDAYDKEQFSVYYQPKHNVITGELEGAEALIRWIHPEYGFLSPGEFIPLFERNGFVSYADYYVLKRTCKNIRKWTDEGIKLVPISVNASRRDFDHEDYVDLVMKPVKENHIDTSCLHIEVTESMFSDQLEAISQILEKCRDLGFKIELDDFGSGYSSLTTLAALPLDVMKLDMSFMKDYKNEKRLKVLYTCIELAKNLGLKTVCEGVELEDQRELLKKCGCDLIQGYYFSKPLPEKEFREYLIKYSKQQ